MKKVLLVGIVAMALVTSAYSETNNQALDRCLKVQNYKPQNFENFDFTKAAGCHQKTIAKNVQRENDEITALLKEKPYYGGDGSGWYKGVEVYSTRNMR